MHPRILNKLYERNSLRNTANGFELAFKNTVAPGTLTHIGPLVIDGVAFDLEKVVLRLERPNERPGRQPSVREWSALALNEEKERMLSFDLYTVARVIATGQQLPPGPHQVALGITTREVGEMTLTAEDSVEE